MSKFQNIFCLCTTLLFLALSAYILRDQAYYPALFVFLLQILVFFLSGKRNLISFCLSFVPAILLLAYLTGMRLVFVVLSAVTAVGFVIIFRSVKPLPRIKTQWWVSTLVMTEILVFAALMAFA